MSSRRACPDSPDYPDISRVEIPVSPDYPIFRGAGS